MASNQESLRIVVIKPSKYDHEGFVERYHKGFMPNATIPFIASMASEIMENSFPEVQYDLVVLDEYVETSLNNFYSAFDDRKKNLLLIVGVQSHQFQRALDIAAFAYNMDVLVVMGGPHPMTCDTTQYQTGKVSFATAEAELVLGEILEDAITQNQLKPVYGLAQRWQQDLTSPVLNPPSKSQLSRYVIPMLGVYPSRGCPFRCNFCSVIKIAGNQVRNQSIETTLETIARAKQAGVGMLMFTSDNFNKYKDATDLLEAMIENDLTIPFFAQCDTQIAGEEDFVELMARAGCFMMFLGVESFSRDALMGVHKTHNKPSHYGQIVRLCERYGILAHFSNIIGFPSDTRKSIHEHLDQLIELGPAISSFYILSPIPGTEQYDDFLKEGIIYEQNLDRFDGTNPTWHHPYLTPSELHSLLFESYHRFYSMGAVWKRFRSMKLRGDQRLWAKMISGVANSGFSRLQAYRHRHPMSGGVWKVKLDHSSEYALKRRFTFEIDMAPLPKSLELSEKDNALNRKARL